MREENVYKGKGEGMVHVYHYCHGQGVLIEWYMS